MKWRDVSETDLNGALAAVKYGYDPIAARNLIEYFYERIQNGERYSERVLLEYLNHAFGKIIEDNWSPNHAFGFKLKRGHRERNDTTERDVLSTAYVILLTRQKVTWLDAVGIAANRFWENDKGDQGVKQAYAQYKEALVYMSDDSLKEMLPCTSLISRDMSI